MEYQCNIKSIFQEKKDIKKLVSDARCTFNTFAAKHLKKNNTSVQSMFQGLLNIEGIIGFNREYLQNDSTYCCETFTECC